MSSAAGLSRGLQRSGRGALGSRVSDSYLGVFRLSGVLPDIVLALSEVNCLSEEPRKTERAPAPVRRILTPSLSHGSDAERRPFWVGGTEFFLSLWEDLMGPWGVVKNFFLCWKTYFSVCLGRWNTFSVWGRFRILRLAVPYAARVFDDIVYWEERLSS